MIFISLDGSNFESTSYNRNKSALKSVSADLETMCEEFSNPIEGLVKIQFSNASKVVTSIALVGDDSLDIMLDIEDDNYAKKMTVKNTETNITVNCADKEAVDFLEIPETARHSIFEDDSKLQCSINITDAEFKKFKALTGLNRESVRVFFNMVNGDEMVVSEIESTDENVRQVVNDLIQNHDYEGFHKFDKLYDKKLIHTEIVKSDGVENYLNCFNKQYFDLVDADKQYTIEFHTNKIRFISFDDEVNVKTYVVMTPVRFA
ncbi:MAG: hypothetical protein NC548_30930 [Lachnospiraceae bacterium]|nr:hypothetical protein [Lachnospiraceae bacterium]